MATVTNMVSQPALPGQSVRIIVNQSDSSNIPNLSIGQLVTISSSSKTGYISEIDTLGGNSFVVTPKYPFTNFNSTTNPEGLLVGETLTF
jgi:hypothetical protein